MRVFALSVCLLFIVFPGASVRAQELIISEIMTTGSGDYRDDDGDITDWVEIFNVSTSSVDLEGWYLTDDPLLPSKWRFPAVTISPGAFLIVYASDKNRTNPATALHANFRLNRLGEHLSLNRPDGTVEFALAPRYPAQSDDFSYGVSQNSSSESALRSNAIARVLVPGANIGSSWTQHDYNDAAWDESRQGVGYDNAATYDPYITTDVGPTMEDQNTSCYVRLPFAVSNANEVSGLTLRMRYDDGYVAYLNGVKIADRNAPSSPAWNSAATGLHDDAQAIVFEEIDVSAFAGALRNGSNVLAIHGLNESLTSSDFLVQAELDLVRVGSTSIDTFEFFDEPSPAGPNRPGFPGVADKPAFSVEGGVFSGSIPVSLSVEDGSQQIRYTTDGSTPTASSPLYSGTITLNSTSFLQARGFRSGFAPSSISSQFYIEISSSLLSRTSNLPIFVIDTLNGGISDGSYRQCFFAVADTSQETGRASLRDDFDFAGRGGIKYRGSSSLGFPKKNYALETWDDRQTDVNVSILGFPSESDWILHGPYSDKSLMRNYLAYKWSNDIGRYAVRTRFVEVYLNTGGGNADTNDYIGVYVFMEKIKRDEDRVDVKRVSGGATSEPEVSGGYIFKKDRADPGDAGFRTSRGTELRYVYPKEEDITDAQRNYVRNYLNQYEAALYGTNFKDEVNGYKKFIDVGSFIDHHIIVELCKNIDGYRLSTFMFKDREGKLNMGPVWDYNLSLRNANYLQGSIPQGWYYTQLSDNDYPWYRRLEQDENYRQAYTDRWTEIRRELFTEERLIADIDEATALLAEAAARNFQRWNILGSYVWPNPNPLATSFTQEVALMKSWLRSRLIWYDGNYDSPPRFSRSPGEIEPGTSLGMSVGSGAIYYTTDGTDPRLPGGNIASNATRYVGTITIDENVRVVARAYLSRTRWSAPTEGSFYTRTAPLVVTELMYHPADPDELSPYDADDFEFVEIRNIGAETVDLAGFYFTDGIDFEFAADSGPIGPGEHIVLVSHLEAFETRYDTSRIRVVGEYTGRLENAGERLALAGPLGEPIFDFTYDESWYPTTDGAGPFLVVVDAFADAAAWSDLTQWAPSEVDGGSPGLADDGSGFGGWQLPGDSNGDGLVDLSDSVRLVRWLFDSTGDPLPCEGTSLVDGSNLLVFDFNGDESVDVSDVIASLAYLFKEGPQHSAGVRCVRLEGCQTHCLP